MQCAFGIDCPVQVHFGEGTSASLPGLLPQRARRVVLLHGRSGHVAAPLITALHAAGVQVDPIGCAGEPSIASVNATAERAARSVPDAVIACGGGAVLDTGKALAVLLSHDLRLDDPFDDIDPDLLSRATRIPLIALPTTAGTGAEVTANAVLDVPSRRAKVSLRGRALYPRHAIVDPALMVSAPRHVVLASGLDAVCQLIESHTSCAATPFSDALTRSALPTALRALRGVVEGGAPDAWRDMAWASLASGLALANSGLGAAHGMASVLGGRYGAPHGALCGRLLLPVLRGNAALAQEGSDASRRIADCISLVAEACPAPPGADQLAGLDAWLTGQPLPRLADYDVGPGDVEALARASAAASSSRKNAVPWEPETFAAALRAAL